MAVGAALFWSWRDSTRALAVVRVGVDRGLPVRAGSGRAVHPRHRAAPPGAAQGFSQEPAVIETLARVDTVVFDKTGTLTASGAGSIVFWGEPLARRGSGLHLLAGATFHPSPCGAHCRIHRGESIPPSRCGRSPKPPAAASKASSPAAKFGWARLPGWSRAMWRFHPPATALRKHRFTWPSTGITGVVTRCQARCGPRRTKPSASSRRITNWRCSAATMKRSASGFADCSASPAICISTKAR